jgi:hypothetical protein
MIGAVADQTTVLHSIEYSLVVELLAQGIESNSVVIDQYYWLIV